MMIWIVITLVAGLGLLAAWLGLRGRRINDHPICCRCKFDLVGVYAPEDSTTEARCPECGRDLNARRTVRIGARQTRPLALASGALLLLLAIAIGGAWGWGRASNFNWNTIKPVWMLRFEADSANDGASEAALTELVARAAKGDLSERAFRDLAVRAMEIQGDHDHPWRPMWGNLIELAHRSTIISDGEFEQSIERSAQLWTMVDPSSVPHDFSHVLEREPDHPTAPKPLYEGEQQFLPISFAVRGAAWTDLFMRPVLEGFVVDGREVSVGAGMHQQMGMVGTSGFNNISVQMLDSLPPGVHQAETSWRLHVFKDFTVHRSKWASGAAAFDAKTGEALELPLPFRKRERTPMVSFPLTLKFQFTVELQRTPQAVHLVRDPALKELIEDSITIQFKEVRREGEYVHFLLERSVSPIPVALAFDMTIREGDREWPSAPLHVGLDGDVRPKSMRVLAERTDFGVTGDRVDLILRPNPKSVEHAEGFDAIWADEVILRDVPIEWADQSTDNAEGGVP